MLAFGAQRRLRFGWLKQRAVYLPSQALLLQDVRLKELPNLSLRSNTSFLLLDVEIRVRTARVEQDERARSFGDSLARWPRHRHRAARRAAAPPAVSSTATADRTGQSGLTTRLAASAGLQLPRGGGGGKRHCSASCCCRAWRDVRAGRFSSRRRDGPIGLRQGKRSTGLARQAKPPLFSPGLAPRALEASHARPRKSPAIICACARASAEQRRVVEPSALASSRGLRGASEVKSVGGNEAHKCPSAGGGALAAPGRVARSARARCS